MSQLVFLKLGGSLITNKRQAAGAREGVIRRVAGEVRQALEAADNLSLVIGHGSGSFGHHAAQQHGFAYEAQTDWRGFVEIGAAAARLNRLVVDVFLEEGIPVFAVQPSASCLSRKGEMVRMEEATVREGLRQGVVPLVYGDVCVDEVFGWTIVSTEQVLGTLGRSLKPELIVLAGDVGGVYTSLPMRDADAQLIPAITNDSIEEVRASLTGADGFDVTGGMLGKVEAALAMVGAQPGLEAHIISGLEPGEVFAALMGQPVKSRTVIRT